MMWNETIEAMDRKALEAMQLEKLRHVVRRAYDNVPLYRAKYDEAGVRPDDLESLDDIRKLPFTVKDDFRQAYPFGLFAVDRSEVVRVHASSGTTGKPPVVGYTRADIAMWAEVVMRTLVCGDATPSDVVQVAYGYGLFTGGLGLHYGAERLGAMVVPMSGGNTKRQIMLMQDFGTTLLACTPSYALQIAEVMGEMGIDPADLKLRVGYFGAEPWSNSIRREIEKRLPVKALDIYGLSEVIGPGVSSECLQQDGLHICEDHFLPEVVDPETLEPVPPGERGELVFTCLSKEATALVRYRTRDLSSLNYERCGCGRTMVRMERITGRQVGIPIPEPVTQRDAVPIVAAEPERIDHLRQPQGTRCRWGSHARLSRGERGFLRPCRALADPCSQANGQGEHQPQPGHSTSHSDLLMTWDRPWGGCGLLAL